MPRVFQLGLTAAIVAVTLPLATALPQARQAAGFIARDLPSIHEPPHAYFEQLRSLPEHFAHWSLRDQQQLDELTNLGTSRYFTYTFPADEYGFAQDGAKFFKPVDDRLGAGSDSIPGNQQLRMPLQIESGSVLITWDFWYGPEFRHNIGRLANYKTFQVRQGNGTKENGRLLWTHVNRFREGLAADEMSKVFESLSAAGLPFPPGVSDREPLTPPGIGALGGNVFGIKTGRWTRYWIEIALSVPATDPRWREWKSLNSQSMTLSGSWHMLSLWIADENTDPVRIIHRVPWATRGTHLSSFDFEFNTSSTPPAQTGPLIGYGRNVVVLHNYRLPEPPEADARVFVRPARDPRSAGAAQERK
jgi:hypothetical protein